MPVLVMIFGAFLIVGGFAQPQPKTGLALTYDLACSGFGLVLIIIGAIMWILED